MAVNFIYVRLEIECHHSSYAILSSVITVDLQDTMLNYYMMHVCDVSMRALTSNIRSCLYLGTVGVVTYI